MTSESEFTNVRCNPMETELDLVRAAAASIFDKDALGLAEALARKANWMQVLWLARQHRLLAVLGEVVAEIRDCPDIVRDQLAAFRKANAIAKLVRASEVVLLSRSFEKASLEVITLGDWAFGEWVYPRRELSQDRPRLEFLIRAEDRPAVERCARDLDYDLRPDRWQLQRGDKSRIKLHEGLESQTADAVSGARVWERTEYRELGGSRVRILHPAVWLDVLCARLANSRRVLLGHAFDVLTVAARAAAPGDKDAWTKAGLLASHRLIGLRTSGSSSEETERLDQSIRRRCPMFRVEADELPATPTSVEKSEVGSLGLYSPTPPNVVDRMLALAGTTSRDVVYDLGCGDGRVVVAAARNYGARAVGIESDPRLVAEARSNAAGFEELVTFIEGDILEADVSQASIVCLYLQGFAYRLIRERVIQTLRPGTRIVSNDVSFADWPPIRTEIVDSGASTVTFVFVWQI